MSSSRLRIRLFGPFAIAWEDGEDIELSSTKLKALIALLATAPDGQRSRAWLQDMLWSLSGPKHGRASLRQAMVRLRRIFGDAFDDVFATTNDTIRLKKGAYRIVGASRDGEVLEGLDLPDEGLNDWLREQRAAPSFHSEPVAAAPITVGQPLAHALPHSVPHEEIGPVRGPVRILPSIGVLPFVSLDQGMSGQLGDAIAQDITRTLSRSPLLHVISHLSCRDDALRQASLGDVRTLIDADYLVGGHIRVAGERYRLDVDFIDASSGQLRWTRDYSGSIKDLWFADHDIVAAIAGDAVRTILQASLEPVAAQDMNVPNHTLLMSAIEMMNKQALHTFARSRACLEQLVERAPRQPMPYAWLAKWYVFAINQGWSSNPQTDAVMARDNAARAVDINPNCAFSMAVNGLVEHYGGVVENAFDSYEDALAVDPNSSLAWLLKGTLHAFIGEGAVAVEATERARALSPLDPQGYFYDSLTATAYLSNGDYESALKMAERSLAQNSRHTSTLRVRTIALQKLGREEEAQEAARVLRRREPTFTVSNYLSRHPAAHYPTGRDWADALEHAGVPVQ